MPPRCTICFHADHEAIDNELASGVTYMAISRKYEVGPEAVRRHAMNHLSPALAKVRVAATEEEAADLITRVEGLIARAELMFTAAAKDGQSKQALDVLKELRQLLELYGKATGELKPDGPQVTVNLMASPEWLAIRDAILTVLCAYPEARTAVTGRLLQLEAGS